MDVFGQFVIAELDKTGSMFDFQVLFFIVNPEISSIQAFYHFDKHSKAPRGVNPDKLPKEQIQVFKGPMVVDVNERKPFKYASMTGKGVGRPIDAQVGLESSKGSEKFKLRSSSRRRRATPSTSRSMARSPHGCPMTARCFPASSRCRM